MAEKTNRRAATKGRTGLRRGACALIGGKRIDGTEIDYKARWKLRKRPEVDERPAPKITEIRGSIGAAVRLPTTR